MAKERAKTRKPKKQPQSTGKKQSATQQANGGTPQSAMAQLQQQVGNRAATAWHQGRRAFVPVAEAGRDSQGQQQAQAKAQVEAGKVKIEKPRIEYYDVTGKSLAEVKSQLLRDGKWCEYEYKYVPKVENGVVTRVDVTVTITLRLPRWTGPGWEQAPRNDKLEWLRMLSLEAAPGKYEDVTHLPGKWLGPGWEQVSDTVKGEWRGMLQALQKQEQGHVDVILRRVLVLQQRMLNQPDKQVKAIFAQFIKDLGVEMEAYNHQLKFGQREKISLGTNSMIQ